ncbi:MAG: UDP-N-acetylmuramoyl-L-alanyl-D-glutamate--2,6-diaminopimelate ligase [Eubacteriales bacterium]
MTILELLADVRISDILAVSLSFDGTQPCGMPRRDAGSVRAGDVFFCIRGTRFDGHDAIGEAVRRGAGLVVLSDMRYANACPVPWICVRSTSEIFLPACLAAAGHPEDGMHLYAVTGTNGKTSVTYLLEAMFSASDASARDSVCTVIGTVENRIAGHAAASSQTTPPPEELCEILCRSRKAGVGTVILEASSHALAQHRLSGLHFDAGIFTNLTEDHLDYHKNMEDYFRCKRQLFLSCEAALINIDDPFGRRLFADDTLPAARVSFSVCNSPQEKEPCAGRQADVRSFVQNTGGETRLTLSSRLWGQKELYSPLRGRFAAANITAAAALCLYAGLSFDAIQAGLSRLVRIPGRMECIVSEPFSVFLDYAHTPDALSRAIVSVREMPGGDDARVLVLFGCGGDREHEKRPMMGRIAADGADICVITSDNSRSEEPADIIAAITRGIGAHPRAEIHVIPDRRTAIEAILDMARPHDRILLAGKGHETYQCDKTGRHPFSERDIVLSRLPLCLSRLQSGKS